MVLGPGSGNLAGIVAASGDNLSPERVRARLRFDVERLRQASARLDAVEDHLRDLKRHLETRAHVLATRAVSEGAAEMWGGDHPGRVALVYAQAQAVADLARRSSITDILLRRSGRLALVSSMALGRWLATLQKLSAAPVPSSVIHGHVRAGRVAHRTLRTLKPSCGMRRYCGLLTSSVVVAEFVHPDNEACIHGHLRSGVERARRRPGRSDEAILEAVSAALRTGARLVEGMASRAEPAGRRLALAAETIEADVEARLTPRTSRPGPS